MDFSKAIQAHAAWKMKLSQYLSQDNQIIDPVSLSRDDQCDLGKWLYSEGQAYKHLPEFNQLIHEHKHFHKEAAAIVIKKNRGEPITEEIALNAHSPFALHSKNVVKLLMDLRAKVK